MKIVIQRVRQTSVIVREKKIASIRRGLLLLVGIDESDTEETVHSMVNKVLKFRIFSDNQGKMNHSVLDIGGEILLVPNFTLSATTQNGNRPSFAKAAPPGKAEMLFDKMYSEFSKSIETQKGQFGADMDVKLLNDGPVTFILQNE
ncbi:MAG TPA: D-aminoacyl-tRNA deacylase [Balneolaceae bacterium]|nr:D-aminoacyl-tRNA deacylase [Balneolaceae bacterium]